MYTDLKGKTALITGSGKKSGIGYAIAKKLASFGTNIIISDLGSSKEQDADVKLSSAGEIEIIASELKEEFKIDTMAIEADVTNSEDINKMVESIQSRFNQLEILCNNAGATFGVPNGVLTYDEDAWMKTIDVNLHSVFKVTRAVMPLMQKSGGSIINTASRAGKVPPLFNGAYAVAKAGVIMLSKVLAKEIAGMNIRVNSICPGQIMTDLEKWRFELEAKFLNSTVEERERIMCESIPAGRIGTSEEVADLAAFLASDSSSYITGQAMNICGGQLMEL